MVGSDRLMIGSVAALVDFRSYVLFLATGMHFLLKVPNKIMVAVPMTAVTPSLEIK